MTTAQTRAPVRPAIPPLRGQRLRELIASSPMDARLVVPALALAAACGPQSDWEEPELVSRACDTKDPIQLSSRAGSAYNLAAIGDAWAIGSGRWIDDTYGVIDTVLFDPCGAGDIEVLERTVVHRVGDGHLRCAADAPVGWVEAPGAPAVPLVASEHCMQAADSEHGVLIDDLEGRLLLYRSPQSEPSVIATDVAQEFQPGGSDPLWVTDGDLVWYVQTDGTLERVDVVTGERIVLADRVASLERTPSGDAVVWTRVLDDFDPGTTSIHRIAAGDVVEIAGGVRGIWPGLVIVSTWSTTTLLDVATANRSTVHTPIDVAVVRADRDSASIIMLTASTKRQFQSGVYRIDLLEDRATYLTDIRSANQIAIDSHGDGILVTEILDDHPDDDEVTQDRMRLLRISRSGDVRVIVKDLWYGYAVASDGRVLYTPMLEDQTPSRDVRVRNPDGSDRVFAHDASLLAPVLWPWPYASNAELVDLEGDVLVNRREGDHATLWRMPFDPDG